MNIESFIIQKEFDNISGRLQSIREEIQRNSFNLFTISSYNSYLENFHSDVIAILLNPEERHFQNKKYLNLFLDFIIVAGVNIDKDDYALCEVTREKGRIDIWLKDNTSKRSIIIENKINDAVDRENQLVTYYKYAKDSGFEIDCIIYLTLSGNKNAPITDIPELNEKLLNVSAFTNSEDDICNGWLKKCFENSEDEDSRSFIFQYLKLVKHLSQVGMDKQIKDDFYSVINKEDGLQKTKAIAELVAGLEEYRADLFATKINDDYLPFKKIYRWRPNHWLFENFNFKDTVFKLDVYFNSDGSARIDFWNPDQPEEIQKNNTSRILKNIDLFNQFEFGGFGGGMFKVFDLKQFINIQAIDDGLYIFVKELFDKFRGLNTATNTV